MAILIRNRSMPENCTDCPMSEQSRDIFCHALHKYIGWDEVPEGRLTDCPLEEIRCEDCRHSAVVATLEHNDGTVEKYYMCKLLREGTDADGFCHRGKRKEQPEDDTDKCCDADEEE